MSESKPPGAEHLTVSWETFHLATFNMGEMIKACNLSIHTLIGVTRGGLIPTCILGHQLGIRSITSIGCGSYGDDRKQRDFQVHNEPSSIYSGKGCLVVDDIFDSGETFNNLRIRWPQAWYASVYYKTEQPYMSRPDILKYHRVFTGMLVPKELWVEFPWEQ